MDNWQAHDLFVKAAADFAKLQQDLQVTADELTTIFLLILAKDVGVQLPQTFSGLTANYQSFLKGQLNDEKKAINGYLAKMNTSLETLQYALLTLVAEKLAVTGIQPLIPSLPAAPYIAPPQR